MAAKTQRAQKSEGTTHHEGHEEHEGRDLTSEPSCPSCLRGEHSCAHEAASAEDAKICASLANFHVVVRSSETRRLKTSDSFFLPRELRAFVVKNSTPMTPTPSSTLWTRTFLLLCTAQFFGSSHHALLQPTFPLYITVARRHAAQGRLRARLLRGDERRVSSAHRRLGRPLVGAASLTCGLLLLAAAVFLCFIPFAEVTMFANALRGIGWAGYERRRAIRCWH